MIKKINSRKKMVLVAGIVLVTIVIVGLIFLNSLPLIEEEKPVPFTEPDPTIKPQVESDFTEIELEQINSARDSYSESGGHDVVLLLNFFESSQDLEKLFLICKNELVVKSISCYRLLAIKKPQQKDLICDQIKPELCEGYQNTEDCKTKIEEIKGECIQLFPFIR